MGSRNTWGSRVARRTGGAPDNCGSNLLAASRHRQRRRRALLDALRGCGRSAPRPVHHSTFAPHRAVTRPKDGNHNPSHTMAWGACVSERRPGWAVRASSEGGATTIAPRVVPGATPRKPSVFWPNRCSSVTPAGPGRSGHHASLREVRSALRWRVGTASARAAVSPAGRVRVRSVRPRSHRTASRWSVSSTAASSTSARWQTAEPRPVVAEPGGEVVADVDRVDGDGLQGVALQVRRLRAVGLREGGPQAVRLTLQGG